MLAQSLYPHGELQHRKWADLQDMCWRKGCNWNNLETVEKRGACVYKREVTIESKHSSCIRRKFVIDREIPIFTSQEADLWFSERV